MTTTEMDPLVLSCLSEGKTYLADFQVAGPNVTAGQCRIIIIIIVITVIITTIMVTLFLYLLVIEYSFRDAGLRDKRSCWCKFILNLTTVVPPKVYRVETSADLAVCSVDADRCPHTSN